MVNLREFEFIELHWYQISNWRKHYILKFDDEIIATIEFTSIWTKKANCSTASGDWTNLNSWSEYDGSSWITPASVYPGQNSGAYVITILSANTIDFRTTSTSLHTGVLNINGVLNLNVTGNGNPDVINLNSSTININAGNLNFVGSKVRLNLVSTAIISITNNGTITASTCNNNNTIYIGSSSYLVSKGKLFTQTALDRGLSVVTSYESMVKNSGALFSIANRYYNVGKLAGLQAENILFKGKKPIELPIRSLARNSLFVNMEAAEKLKLYPPIQLLRFAELINLPD